MTNTLKTRETILKVLKWIKWILLVILLILLALMAYDHFFVEHWNGSYCSQAVKCEKCIGGQQECYYEIENDDGTFSISEDTIHCDCFTNEN